MEMRPQEMDQYFLKQAGCKMELPKIYTIGSKYNSQTQESDFVLLETDRWANKISISRNGGLKFTWRKDDFSYIAKTDWDNYTLCYVGKVPVFIFSVEFDHKKALKVYGENALSLLNHDLENIKKTITKWELFMLS